MRDDLWQATCLVCGDICISDTTWHITAWLQAHNHTPKSRADKIAERVPADVEDYL